MSYRVLGGDCVARLNMLDEESIDNCITDPPYEIGFMGQGWDNTGVAYNPATWRAVHRVLKPNGYMLVFGATKTHHRIADAIQRAGFEIVDIIAWCYGTGFPKSHNIGKAVDKLEGNEREVVGVSKNDRPNSQVKGGRGFDSAFNKGQEHQPIIETKGQSQWEGWGTALKPAWEPIIVARKKGSQRNVDYSQFYYIAKPSKSEKNAGLEAFEDGKNTHPTVKPVKLMKKLVEEFTEEDSTVLDPFTGSGTTGMASVISDRDFIGCELTSEYIPLAKARIGFAQENKSFFD